MTECLYTLAVHPFVVLSIWTCMHQVSKSSLSWRRFWAKADLMAGAGNPVATFRPRCAKVKMFPDFMMINDYL